MSEVLIRTENLVHKYPKGGVTALKGIDLQIYKGDVVSIIGQNGSGKTTLVRHFNGLLKPTSGKVYMFGEDTEGKSVRQMSQKCGYVFQNPNHQIFCSSVKDELEVAPNNYGFDEETKKKNMDEIIELMGIGDILDKHPMTLDYTTKKIVTIASILVYKPEILILDEPTGGLDEHGRRILTKIIDMMHASGHTLIMISHDMDYVAEVSKRIIVMTQGEIKDDDVPEKVFLKQSVLAAAQLEPPQITSLDLWMSGEKGGEKPALTVQQFVSKHKAVKGL